MTVRDIDKGWRKIIAGLDELQKSDVLVGVHEGEERLDDEMSSAELAALHEFGSEDGTVPERSFLRASTDHYSDIFGEAFSDAFKDIVALRRPARQALNRIGLLGQAKVREFITVVGQSVWPDISDATKKRKGSSKILIDTGQLRRDITYIVEANPTAERVRMTGL